MKRPSELREDEGIIIQHKTGAIGFHREYGELYVFACLPNTDPTEGEHGLLITSDPTEADNIYADHAKEQLAPGITITEYTWIHPKGYTTKTRSS